MAQRVNRAAWYAQIKHTPRLWQRLADEALDSGARYGAAFAFPRAGKSLWAARYVEPLIITPDNHGWIVAPTYALGAKEFQYIIQDFAETGWLRHASSIHNDIRGGNMSIRFKFGSWVEVVSADNPTALRGEELDWVILAEAGPQVDNIYHRHLFARTEKRKAKVLIPTTPAGYSWVYDTFRVPSLATLPDKQWGPWENDRRFLTGKEPNPRYDAKFWSAIISAVPDFGEILETSTYDVETIDRARRTLPAPIFAEQFGGDFASYAGRIYPFDPIEHVCEPFTIPEDWTHVVGWDHGADNPTAIMFGSYGPDGTLYWWGEIYKAGYSAGEFLQMARGMLGGKSVSAWAIDPSAKQVRIELARYGVATTIPQDRQIEARIIRTTSLMREGKYKILRGRCPNLVREVTAWEWDDDALPSKPRPRPRQPCHAIDGSGYASLIPVQLPGADPGDPDVILGEDPRLAQLWKPVRKRWREIEEDQQQKIAEDVLFDDPFEEIGLRGEEYNIESA